MHRPRANSSVAIAWSTSDAPEPPYSSGYDSAVNSIARSASKAGHEYSPRRSASAANGAILSVANCRTTARNWRCSSDSVMVCVMTSV